MNWSMNGLAMLELAVGVSYLVLLLYRRILALNRQLREFYARGESQVDPIAGIDWSSPLAVYNDRRKVLRPGRFCTKTDQVQG